MRALGFWACAQLSHQGNGETEIGQLFEKIWFGLARTYFRSLCVVLKIAVYSWFYSAFFKLEDFEDEKKTPKSNMSSKGHTISALVFCPLQSLSPALWLGAKMQPNEECLMIFWSLPAILKSHWQDAPERKLCVHFHSLPLTKKYTQQVS